MKQLLSTPSTLPWRAFLLVIGFSLLLGSTSVFGQTTGDEPVVEATKKDKKEKKAKKEKKEKKDKDAKKEKKASKDKGKGKSKGKNKKNKDTEVSDTGPSADDSLAISIKQVQDTTVGVLDTTNTHAPWLCGRYHKGKMYFTDKNYAGITIKRTRKKEIWTNQISGNKLKFKVNWEDACYYRLTFIKSKKPSRFKKGYDIGCKITACVEDYYDCVCDVNAIMQYLSVQKDPSNKEVKLKAKKQNAKLKEEEKAARMAEQEAKFKEGKEAEEEAEAKEKGDTGGEEETGDGSKKKSDSEPEEKPVKEKKEKKPKEKKEKKAKKEKKEKAPKEKKEKKPKEKKEKKKKDKDEEEE